MLVSLGKLPAAIAYALGGTPSGDQFEVSPAVGVLCRAFGVAASTGESRITEAGDERLTEDGETRETE